MITFNVGLELEQLLILGSVVLWAIFFFLSLRRQCPAKAYYLLALGLLPAYLNWKLFLDPEGLLTPLGLFDMWFRHLFFYSGQLFFFLFVLNLFNIKIGRIQKTLMVLAYLFLLILPTAARAFHSVNILEIPATPYNLLLFLTDQGVQHILAIIFFFLTIAIVRTKSMYPGLGALNPFMIWLFIANGFFILIHIWEYLAESLHFFGFLSHDLVESIEFVFQYAGLLLLYLKSEVKQTLTDNA